MKFDLNLFLVIFLCLFFGLLIANTAFKSFNREGMENKEEAEVVVAKKETKVKKPLN